jgi:hypothetical protein
MTDQTAPPEIWLDPRVARTIPQEPAELGSGLVRYFSADRVKELVDMARGGPEFFIQIMEGNGHLMALTNFGNVWRLEEGGEWWGVHTPDLTGPDADDPGGQ